MTNLIQISCPFLPPNEWVIGTQIDGYDYYHKFTGEYPLITQILNGQHLNYQIDTIKKQLIVKYQIYGGEITQIIDLIPMPDHQKLNVWPTITPQPNQIIKHKHQLPNPKECIDSEIALRIMDTLNIIDLPVSISVNQSLQRYQLNLTHQHRVYSYCLNILCDGQQYSYQKMVLKIFKDILNKQYKNYSISPIYLDNYTTIDQSNQIFDVYLPYMDHQTQTYVTVSFSHHQQSNCLIS